MEQQQARAVRQSHRAEELEDVLAGVTVKVQGLEDSIISKAAQQQGQLHHLQQDKRDAEVPLLQPCAAVSPLTVFRLHQ